MLFLDPTIGQRCTKDVQSDGQNEGRGLLSKIERVAGFSKNLGQMAVDWRNPRWHGS